MMKLESCVNGGCEFDAEKPEVIMESSVPPGFRFHPTDEELVGYYLRKKIASQKIDLDVIRDIDLYRIEPWDLQEKCRIGYEEQKEWYFFSHKDKKYPTGTRTNRATMVGFWKATGRDKAVYDNKMKLIGMRKTLVFYKGRAPNGHKSDWIMHEYRLESHENGPPQEEGWVVCRAFKKRTSTGQTKAIEEWDSSSFYIAPMENLVSTQNLICNKENDNLNNLHYSDPFSQLLPPLESPSLPLLQKQTAKSLAETKEEEKEDKKKVRDWRDLDRFVASQLMSQDQETTSYSEVSRFGACSDSDMAVVLLQGRDEINGAFSDGVLDLKECGNIGMCIYEK